MARQDGELWGRLVESAVGAHLLNTAPTGMEITYWRERDLPPLEVPTAS